MASQTRNVVRYSMLIGGIGYGIFHQRTLQAKHDLDKKRHKEHHREELIAQAREAYKNKLLLDKAGSGADAALLDADSPKFDLEKLMDSLDKTPA